MFKLFSNLWNQFREYVVLVILVIISLSLLTQNNNQQVQKVRAVAFGSFATVTTVFYDLFNITQLKNENSALRKVNAEMMMQLSMLREQGILNTELKGMLELRDTTSLPLIPATIVSNIEEEKTGLLNLIHIKPFEEVLSVENVFILMMLGNAEKNNLELNFYNRK